MSPQRCYGEWQLGGTRLSLYPKDNESNEIVDLLKDTYIGLITAVALRSISRLPGAGENSNSSRKLMSIACISSILYSDMLVGLWKED